MYDHIPKENKDTASKINNSNELVTGNCSFLFSKFLKKGG